MRRYIQKNAHPSTDLRQFNYTTIDNNITLTWDWPTDRSIRLALVFACEEETDIAKLLDEKHPHDVIVRDLASQFTASIDKGRRKFVVCPAFFEDNQTIAVCTPGIITDWVYKKTKLSVQISYKPLQFSTYQKASFIIIPEDMEMVDLITKALTYTNLGNSHPINSAIIASGGILYNYKGQQVTFSIHPDYAHLFEICHL